MEEGNGRRGDLARNGSEKEEGKRGRGKMEDRARRLGRREEGRERRLESSRW